VEKKLTKREREITALVVRGYTNKEIGNELMVTEQTVKNLLSKVFQKLHFHHRVELAIYALEHGLLNEEERSRFNALKKFVDNDGDGSAILRTGGFLKQYMDTATRNQSSSSGQTPSYQTIQNNLENWDGQKITESFRESVYALGAILKETNVRQCLEQALQQHQTGQSRSTAAGSSGTGSPGGMGLR
jgi:DNA-binding CsgD family transcriptional regulator